MNTAVLLVAVLAAAALLPEPTAAYWLTDADIKGEYPLQEDGPAPKGVPSGLKAQIIKTTANVILYLRAHPSEKKTNPSEDYRPQFLHEIYVCSPYGPVHDLVQPHTTYNKILSWAGVEPFQWMKYPPTDENYRGVRVEGYAEFDSPTPSTPKLCYYAGDYVVREFTAGQEIVPCTEHCYILPDHKKINTTDFWGAGEQFRTGPGSRNPDGAIHTIIDTTRSTPSVANPTGSELYSCVFVKFEDRWESAYDSYIVGDTSAANMAKKNLPKDFDDTLVEVCAYYYTGCGRNAVATAPAQVLQVVTV